MSVAAAPRLMTTEELLAMPADGVDRWLIEGRLFEGKLPERPMTVGNRVHSEIMALITLHLGTWRLQQPVPRGKVLCGEAGVRLKRDPDTTVGVDVVYVSPELVARQGDDTTLVDGVPVLAVEILSPNDTVEEIENKIDTFLRAGVALVWIVNPRRRTVTVHQPGSAPVLLTASGELCGDPHLPGFRVPVTSLFE